MIEDQCAAGWQRHFTRVDEFNLTLNIECVEERRASIPVAEQFARTRSDDFEECLRAAERAFAINDDRFDIAIDAIANRAKKHITFRVQLAGRAHSMHALLELLPESREVLRIAHQFGARGIKSCGAQNESESFFEFERVENLSHRAPLIFVVDLSAHADVVHVRHHHEQTTWKRQVARDGWTLGSESFFENLHENLLAALERVLHHRAVVPRNLASDFLSAFHAGEILRMEIADVEESIGSLTEVDERRLNCGFDIEHASLVDAADICRSRRALGEVLRKRAVFKDRNAHLLAGIVIHENDDLGLWNCAALGCFIVVCVGRCWFDTSAFSRMRNIIAASRWSSVAATATVASAASSASWFSGCSGFRSASFSG